MNLTKRGFTLIELLVVIAIIGILSSIVLASLNTARLKSRDARRVADIKQLQLAMQLYYDANSSYPATLAALVSTYIASVPTDPVGQIAYPYEALPAGCVPNTAAPCSSYHIGADLEDANNQALNSDIDDVNGVIVADLAPNGDGENCAGTATTRFCYDVGP
jgi:general secretion pathway protein G